MIDSPNCSFCGNNEESIEHLFWKCSNTQQFVKKMTEKFQEMSIPLNLNERNFILGCFHGGNSKGTTCVVDRDVTAYLVVDRVLRIPTEQYGCRYVGYPGFNDVKVNF